MPQVIVDVLRRWWEERDVIRPGDARTDSLYPSDMHGLGSHGRRTLTLDQLKRAWRREETTHRCRKCRGPLVLVTLWRYAPVEFVGVTAEVIAT